MKHIFAAATFASLTIFTACNSYSDKVKIEITKTVINENYLGIGVEWDPYDEAQSWDGGISDNDWEKLYTRLDHMRPQYIRCMINSPYTYFNSVSNLYDKNRNNENIIKLLSYCQKNDIMVVYGEFNPPTAEMTEAQGWIEMSVDYLDYLISELGFNCIKYFVIFNEPDGDWSYPNGDYELYKSMVERFTSQIRKYPSLSSVTIAGPDVVMNYKNPSSEYDMEEWLEHTAQDMDNCIGVYDIHAYPGQKYVRSGEFAKDLRKLKSHIPEDKKIILGEAGYKYNDKRDSLLMREYERRAANHPFTRGSDCNMLVYDYFYALDMSLLAIETMNNGFSGVAAWMLDDAMHSNGDTGKPEDIKIWGMWNILGEEVFNDPAQEETRPWYYTWSLMSKYFPAGSDILEVNATNVDGLHFAAAEKDGSYTFAAVNLTDEEINIIVRFPKVLKNAKLYHIMEDNVNLHPEEKSVSAKTVKLTTPAQSFSIITEL